MKNPVGLLSSALATATLLLAQPAHAGGGTHTTYGNKDTISVVASSTNGNNFYFWTSITTGACGNGTKWQIPNLADAGDKEIARLAEMAFMSGSRVAMSYTCSGSTAVVSYIKVYR